MGPVQAMGSPQEWAEIKKPPGGVAVVVVVDFRVRFFALARSFFS
jgi:hypothetical protein